MIYVIAPLRISLGGGGTDLPWWYKKNSAYLISVSIDKYVHIIGSKRVYDNKIWLSYSKTEIVNKISQIKNEIFKEVLNLEKIKPGIEIHTISDVPGHSGLGSSGAFTAGLIYFSKLFKKNKIIKKKIAERACRVEMDLLKKSSGKQDQYISVYGGFKEIKINKKGEVKIKKIKLKKKIITRFNKSMFLVHTKISRKSDIVLKSQKKNFVKKKKIIGDIMHKIQKIGIRTKKVLTDGNVVGLGKLFDEHWFLKEKLSTMMSNPSISNIYKKAKKNGAIGGKLLGAGGGGYFLFIVLKKNKRKFFSFLNKNKLVNLPFKFDQYGIRKFKENK